MAFPVYQGRNLLELNTAVSLLFRFHSTGIKIIIDNSSGFINEANVYDIIIAKPRTKEPHIDYIFHNEPSWSGEITIERWDELKRMPFSELYLSLVGVRYEGKEFTFGKYKGQTFKLINPKG